VVITPQRPKNARSYIDVSFYTLETWHAIMCFYVGKTESFFSYVAWMLPFNFMKLFTRVFIIYAVPSFKWLLLRPEFHKSVTWVWPWAPRDDDPMFAPIFILCMESRMGSVQPTYLGSACDLTSCKCWNEALLPFSVHWRVWRHKKSIDSMTYVVYVK
jgi:hypothetical protein